jgi:hypothetical protein
LGSIYKLDANERPHLYAHSRDLRQFPVVGFDSLLMVLAAKQRIENIRRKKKECSSAMQLNSMDNVEIALQHLIFDLLATTTHKVDSQKNLLRQVKQAVRQNVVELDRA